METIWIIGAGKFGLRAAKWLVRHTSFNIILVDQDRDCLARAEALGCGTRTGDGVAYLHTHLTPETGPDWVVPAVPVHLAWEWCRLYLGDKSIASGPLPGGIEDFWPNAMNGAGGDIYVSHADFICPPNCNEPDDRCTKTGKPRKKDMFTLLAETRYQGVTPFVVQSVQLGPGVGGYRPHTLFDLADRISRHRGLFFVATACRCHGVVSGGQHL